ncbi:hypothetical protein N7495_008465 [Penicillium taxi]|uniref:uncharacterized protein n=1 Tax=Penicillium taxi TaxID=168475 RepID=UPI0025459C66|nr:uncharacterized protein N7495_008465 [Penicillium taxi]KAJ5888424.1 hypothetical protein N7495_008465 [Penicillium taxi]
MPFDIPVLVFLAANIWGIFGEIPFTAIQPTRSFFDRALGSFQLASTVYTLQPLIQTTWSENSITTWLESIDSTYPTEQDIFQQMANITLEFIPQHVAHTNNEYEAMFTTGATLQVDVMKKMPSCLNQSSPKSTSSSLELKEFPTWVLSVIIVSLIVTILMRQQDQTQQIHHQTQYVHHLLTEIGQHQYDLNRRLGDLQDRIPPPVVLAELCQHLNFLQDDVTKILIGQNSIDNFLRISSVLGEKSGETHVSN